MNVVQPLLVVTKDAPKLPIPLALAAATITQRFSIVQESFRQVVGKTFALAPCMTYRSKQDCPYNQWGLYDELEEQGLVERRGSCLSALYYMEVWCPPANYWITGTLMARPVGRCLDGIETVQDLLRLSEPAKPSFNEPWGLGRIRHELEHGLGGPYPERIFGNWWDYGQPNSIPPDSTQKQVEIATLNPDFLRAV